MFKVKKARCQPGRSTAGQRSSQQLHCTRSNGPADRSIPAVKPPAPPSPSASGRSTTDMPLWLIEAGSKGWMVNIPSEPRNQPYQPRSARTFPPAGWCRGGSACTTAARPRRGKPCNGATQYYGRRENSRAPPAESPGAAYMSRLFTASSRAASCKRGALAARDGPQITTQPPALWCLGPPLQTRTSRCQTAPFLCHTLPWLLLLFCLLFRFRFVNSIF
jgi:hypothetical protein